MPKNGWKSLTIRESVYKELHKKYSKQRRKLELEGVGSFSAFVSKKLIEVLDDA